MPTQLMASAPASMRQSAYHFLPASRVQACGSCLYTRSMNEAKIAVKMKNDASWTARPPRKICGETAPLSVDGAFS
jgi:hypothetical protein